MADPSFSFPLVDTALASSETTALVDAPIDFLQADDGDLDISTGDLGFSSGLSGVVRAIDQNLRLCLGEYFPDLSVGLDYFGQILVKAPNFLLIRELLSEQIAAAPYVSSVDVVQLSLSSDRKLSARCEASCDFGTAQVDAALVLPGVL